MYTIEMESRRLSKFSYIHIYREREKEKVVMMNNHVILVTILHYVNRNWGCDLLVR
jgi:hypothetical protein